MRKITKIIVHCSATAAGRDFSAADIDRWHRARGFNGIGYHYVVKLDGTVEKGRSESVMGAHCLGQNANSIGVCYIGGLKSDGKTPADTRTEAQKRALKSLIGDLKKRYPGATVHGHREFAAKACPCFDAAREYAAGLLGVIVLMSLLLASCSSGKRVLKEQGEMVQVAEVARREESVRIDSVLKVMEAEADSVRIGIEYEPLAQGIKRSVKVSVYGPKRRERQAQARVETRQESRAESVTVRENASAEERRSGGGAPPWLTAGILLAALGIAAWGLFRTQ